MSNKNIKTKAFDCVQMMRELRKEINNDIKDMSFSELKGYIKQNLQGKQLIGQA